MADTTKISNAAADAEGDALAALFDNGYLRIYDATGGTGQPASVDTAIGSQVLLAELRFAATAVTTSANGVLTFGAITSDTDANATGTAVWFRAFKSDGTTALWDGSVSTSGATINLNSTSIMIHAQVDVTSLTFTINKG
jgi:hypothetical protein